MKRSEANFSEFSIESDGTSFGSQIFFDGKPVIGVRKVELTIDAARGHEITTAVVVLEGVKANIRLPRGQVTVVDFAEPRRAICPECRNGKHVNCGPALDEVTDEIRQCECEHLA